MKEIETARAKAAAGERLTFNEALALYEENDLLFLADCARKAKERKSGCKVFYTVNRHINLTNICSSNCPLCAFQVEQGDARGFVYEQEDIAKILEKAKQVEDLSEIHIVSALHPDKPFSYYVDVVRQVKAALPKADVKAFTPVEIVNFAKMTGKASARYSKFSKKPVSTVCRAAVQRFCRTASGKLSARKKRRRRSGLRR